MSFPFAVPPGVAPAWDAVVLRDGVVVHASSGGRRRAGRRRRTGRAAALRRGVAHQGAGVTGTSPHSS